MTTGRGADVSEINAVQATGSYFAVLGTRPALGRFFAPEDDELPAGNAVVVLGHDFWKRRFGGERSVLGRPIVIDNDEYTVIGVAPPGFTGADLSPVDVFVPVVALVSAPLVESMLFETPARDVGVLAAAGGMLLTVTIIAAALPAWRAGRVSPMTALRSD